MLLPYDLYINIKVLFVFNTSIVHSIGLYSPYLGCADVAVVDEVELIEEHDNVGGTALGLFRGI